MPRRALILSWEYPPIVEGGLARHVRKVAEGLLDHDYEVHVIARGDAKATEDLLGGVHVHRVREPDWPQNDLDGFLAWVATMNEDIVALGRRLGNELEFDVVHSHDWLVADAGRALSRAFGVPWLVTIHATEHGRHQGWVDRHPQSTIHDHERRMARDADALIVCSHYMHGHVADVFDVPEDRIHVIPNGIDPRDLHPVGDLDTLRARYAEPRERLVLLVGRLVYEKGFQLALQALPRVIARVGDVRFLVAGSGPHEAALRAQATELGLDGHGEFLGWIGDDLLHSLYRIADLCVVPSIYEPFGLVALEAMASGCPCLVADTGGLREVVPHRDVGLRFRAKDSRSLGALMEQLLVDARRRDRLTAEASEHVLRFDWADVARQTAAVYRALPAASARLA